MADRNIRLADQGAFYNVPEEPRAIELNMKAFNRSAKAIAKNRERTAALMRNARHQELTLAYRIAVCPQGYMTSSEHT